MESRYKILEHIDSGGMAEVFKGRAQAIHGIEKTVAIKRILPHLARNRKFVAMFLDEARLSVYLNHANIVQVFDIARSDGNYFIVMEFVEGANLRSLLDAARFTHKPFPIDKAIYIAAAVCRGLAYAHERTDHVGRPLHIVHRDVSPPNILLSFEGEVKLVDFGLAKAASQLENSDPDILKGKLGYMSPEQAWGKALDHRADIFSAGILLYEMLTATRLFRGESDLETLEMVRAAKIQPPRQLNPSIHKELERLVLRALAADPAQRFQTARRLEDELWRFLFQRQMKVTPHDLGVWVQKQTAALPKQDSSTLAIDQMIQEEILGLVSIESYDLPDESPASGHAGSRPIYLGDGSRPIRIDEIRGARAREGGKPVEIDRPAPAVPGATGSPDFTPLTELLEPESSDSSKKKHRGHRGRNRATWWLLVLLLLGGAGIGVYFLLRAVEEPTSRPMAPTTRAK